MDYTVPGILQARILEWVAIPFSRGSSQPRDQTQVSLILGRFFTSWATREASFLYSSRDILKDDNFASAVEVEFFIGEARNRTAKLDKISVVLWGQELRQQEWRG